MPSTTLLPLPSERMRKKGGRGGGGGGGGGRGCRPPLVRLATLASTQPSKRPPPTTDRNFPSRASPRPARHPCPTASRISPSLASLPRCKMHRNPVERLLPATPPTVTGTPLSQSALTATLQPSKRFQRRWDIPD